jgi:hypothetical protein
LVGQSVERGQSGGGERLHGLAQRVDRGVGDLRAEKAVMLAQDKAVVRRHLARGWLADAEQLFINRLE